MPLFDSFEQMGIIALTLFICFVLFRFVAKVWEVVNDFYYFLVVTPRFRRNLKLGDRALLIHSDVPVIVDTVGDRYAYVRVPGTNNSDTGRSLEISELYPLT